jgi:hypothetical protein
MPNRMLLSIGRATALATLVLSVAASAVMAQQAAPDSALPEPRLLTVVPAGARIGSTVEVAFTGTDIEEPETLLFSHPGIKAEPVVPPEAPTPPADPKKPKPPTNAKKPPVIVTKFKVTIAADVPVGLQDVRLVNKWGVSNARAFAIGDLPEFMEVEPNNDVNQTQRIEINSTVNGSMASPTDVDYYVFTGKKGQRVVFSCLASTIDSRFHAALEIYDSKDRLLAFNRNYDHRDALTDCILPADGDYFIRVFEFTHTQGSPEHFYRLTLSTAPWIDAIFPCVVEPGKATPVTVYGRNLPGGQIDPGATVDDHVLEKISLMVNASADTGRLTFSGRLDPKAAALSGFEVRLRNPVGASNPFLLTFARSPVVVDNGANDTPETAQPITLPCEIAGFVEKRRDRDWYVFDAKKGETFLIEALGDRLGSEAFVYFVLRNAATKQNLYESPPDYAEPQPPKFYARTEDPAPYRFVVPADGKYQMLVSSRLADALSGPRHFYRVRLAPETPDFQLAVTPPADHRPDAAVVLQGGHEAFTVFATRRDGFNGDINLTVEGLPPGVTCAPQTIGASVRQTQLVVSATAGAPPAVVELKVKGTATIRGRKVEHEARIAGVVWPGPEQGKVQPLLTRLDRALVLAVRSGAPYTLATTLDKPAVLQGDKTDLKVKLTRLWPDAKTPLTVQAEAANLAPGLTLNNNQPITIAPDKTDGTLLVSVGAGVLPGTYNLVLRTSSPIPFNKDPMAKQKPPIPIVQPSASVSLIVLPKTVATLALAGAVPPVKAGAQAEVTLHVTRLADYNGDFKVKVVIPAAAKGISSDEVTIPAGADQVKLTLKVAPDAAPGNRADLVVRATAVLNGNVPVVQETKFNLNVVKP